MFIGIDANEANVTQHVGANVYSYQLIKHLNEIVDPNQIRVRIYLKQRWQTLFPPKTTSWTYSQFGPKLLWTQWRLPLKLYQEKLYNQAPDIFFTPGHYAPRFSPVPSVISIMDLAFLKFPNEFRHKDLKQLTSWTEYSVHQAAHIFAISTATKNDIVRYYNIDPEKITVTHLGLSKLPMIEQKEKAKSFQRFKAHLGITNPYILYIGTLQPRKNIERLIDAYTLIKQNPHFNQLKLVLVGKKGWLYEDMFKKVKQLKLYDDVIFTGFVSDFEKYELLRNASVYVLPSLYEGFGLPVLEAMSVGTPVEFTNTPSLPEGGGAAAFSIKNPKSEQSIAESIIEVLQLSTNKQMSVIANGKHRVNQFTWEACAQKTLQTLLRIGEQYAK